MQVRAIIEAACECKKQKIAVLPEIMIPLAGTKAELDYLKKFTVETADAVMKEKRRQGRLPVRHDDRSAPRRGDGRRDWPRPPSSSASAPTT